jgi:hypothetical protein
LMRNSRGTLDFRSFEVEGRYQCLSSKNLFQGRSLITHKSITVKEARDEKILGNYY